MAFEKRSFIWVLLAFFMASCTPSAGMRAYEEIVVNPSDEGVASTMPPGHPPIGSGASAQMPGMPSMPSMPGVTADMSLQFAWTLPVDWVERDKGSMRLASFSSGSGETMVDCSIVALGGGAGGLEANIERWMGQINLTFSSENELNEFLSKSDKIKTAEGIEGTLIDFTNLQKNTKSSAPSILALIFPYDGKNVFVKLSGPKSEVLKNKNKFKEFCQSLKAIKK